MIPKKAHAGYMLNVGDVEYEDIALIRSMHTSPAYIADMLSGFTSTVKSSLAAQFRYIATKCFRNSHDRGIIQAGKCSGLLSLAANKKEENSAKNNRRFQRVPEAQGGEAEHNRY